MSIKLSITSLILGIGLLTTTAIAQIAVPIRPYDDWNACWSIRERTVDMVVRDQVASVTVTDQVQNRGGHIVEVQYLLPLPPQAAVDQFTLVVDGRELTGQIMDAQEARQIYNQIVRRQRDPGLLEYADYGLYRSSAFPLSPGKSAELIVHYTATCDRNGDVVELWYPLASGRYTAEPANRFSISADIESAAEIANVYSPSLDLKINRKNSKRVIAKFEAQRYRPVNDFQLFYESSREAVGATFLTYWPDLDQDGYYLMMVSPSPRLTSSSVLPKDIVIVLDRSGSMSGEKIQQAREAARFVVENLNRDDRFNFIEYNDKATPCFESLQSASRRNMDLAVDRLDRMDASGSTNIYEALDMALSQFADKDQSATRPAYIIFLTDGLPTTGNTNEAAILDNTKQVNRADVRIFTFGVGYDVNVRLLDKIVEQNHGRSAYVKPNESIETKVSALYNRIRNPFMTNITAKIENLGTRDDCPSELGDLFENDQLIRVGRIYPKEPGILDQQRYDDCPVALVVTGMLNGAKQTFEYPVTLNLEGSRSPYRFIEKLWATRRIGELLEDIQLHGRVQEVYDELVRLSKQYGIVTPYTSFLADEHRAVTDISSLLKKQPGFKVDPESFDLSESSGAVSDQRTLASQDIFYEPPVVKMDVSCKEVRITSQMNATARSEAMMMAAPPAVSPEGHAMRLGATTQDQYERGVRDEINNIRVVENITLYKRGDTWIASEISDLDPVKDIGKFTVIKRYSDEYFALIADNTPEENKVLAWQKPDEKLAIRLRGANYLIE
ncbi:MAG: VWA domain-containing protein [Calditrichota bacterium]